MKKKLLAIFFVLWLADVFVAPVCAETQTVTLSNIKGEVFFQKEINTEWIPAKEGMKISIGDAIKTGPNGSVKLTFGDAGSLELKEETDIRILKAVIKKGISATEVGLHLGKLRAKIRKLPASGSFEVKTPVSVASVRGTVYDLWAYVIDGSIFAELNVLDGEVFWSNLNRTVEFLLGKGETSTANEQGQLSEPQRSTSASVDQSLGAIPEDAEVGKTDKVGRSAEYTEGFGGQKGFDQQTLGAQDSVTGGPGGEKKESGDYGP